MFDHYAEFENKKNKYPICLHVLKEVALPSLSKIGLFQRSGDH